MAESQAMKTLLNVTFSSVYGFVVVRLWIFWRTFLNRAPFFCDLGGLFLRFSCQVYTGSLTRKSQFSQLTIGWHTLDEIVFGGPRLPKTSMVIKVPTLQQGHFL